MQLATSRRGIRRMSRDDRPDQTNRSDLEERARTRRRRMGRMAEMTNVPDKQLPRGAGSAGEVPIVPAASVILLRDDPFEVLMIRRHIKSSFVPDTWVFPGGA